MVANILFLYNNHIRNSNLFNNFEKKTHFHENDQVFFH